MVKACSWPLLILPMSTQCYVHVGKKAYGYAKEPQKDFEFTVFRLGDTVQVAFVAAGRRHHACTVKTTPEVARWLAHALLATCEASGDARINRLQVKDDIICERITGDISPEANQAPNHALQRTGAAVTPAASGPPPSRPPRSGRASRAGR